VSIRGAIFDVGQPDAHFCLVGGIVLSAVDEATSMRLDEVLGTLIELDTDTSSDRGNAGSVAVGLWISVGAVFAVECFIWKLIAS
jgi:hypothetical protein